VDAEYGQRYRELFERHWWWRAREHVILDALTRHGATVRRQAILDVGCGDGLFFDRLAELGEVEGVEPDGTLVDPKGRWASRIRVAPFDARFAPGKRYSLILMLDVLEHLDDPAAALRHARTLLEPDGLLLITVPAFRALWTRHDDVNHHVTRYTKATWQALAGDAGVTTSEARYFFHWTFPAKLLVRAVEAVRPPRDERARVPATPINAALYGLSRLEHRLLSWAGLPFGSSLLIAAGHPRG
jgi:2-polyprenyl-3-methyl-5-hydroxy-6-metoxy-1,4-benzoquinol methylase